MISRSILRYAGIYSVLILAGLFLTQFAWAVAPSEDALHKWERDGTLDEKLAQWKAFHVAGGDAPSSPSVLENAHAERGVSTQGADGANVVDTINVLVLLVDFPDWHWDGQDQAGTAQDFDSILFSDRRVGPKINPTGSMTDFYLETSYGKLFLHGEIYGWIRMSQNYSYYVGSDDGLSMGTVLAHDAVIAADPQVDYSRFARSGNVNGIVIIHPGPGAESGAYGIWSHKSSISGQPVLDGVTLRDYTVNPEESSGELTPIGVFCHEYGHALGLPDLYDTDYTPSTSEGLGGWSLMASGNYNGSSQKPSHLDPWCKSKLGWLTFTNVGSNLHNVDIPAVEYTPVCYQIKDSNVVGAKEYWLVENRGPYGSDAALPGFGLCIYHVDENVYGNNNYLRYMVALEQADGQNGLALGGSRGDNGDPWPGGTDNRNFHDLSIPNSRSNISSKVTEVGVWNISNQDSVMHADLDYVFSRPLLTFTGSDSLQLLDNAGGNGNGVIEAGETIDVYCRLKNSMRNGYNWYMTLSTDNPDVQFINNHTQQSAYLLKASASVQANNPVRFTLAPGAIPTISDFTLTISADSVAGAGDEAYVKTFSFKQPLGKPNVLIVDDDNGTSSDDGLTTSFNRLKLPQTLYHKTGGSPTASLLQQHKYVFWMSGDKPTGTLTAADVAAMKAYLDGGGNLVIASATAAAQLKALDSSFMRDYLHARYKDSVSSGYYFYGVPGNPLSENSRWRYLTTVSTALKRTTIIEPTESGLLAFELSNRFTGTPYLGHCGVMYSGTYKTAFMTFAIEYVSDRDTLANYAHRDSLTARLLRFFDDTTWHYTGPQVTKLVAVGEVQQNILSNTPTFAWSYYASGVNSQDSAEVEFGSDADWSVAELWNPAVSVGADTTITYAGTALADGATVYARARSHAAGGWSDWYQASFRLNSAPAVPTLLAPTSGGVLGPSGAMTVQTVTDAEGDPVSYNFVVFADSTLSSQEANALVTSGTWTVPIGALTEDTRRWWQVRTFDGYEYSPWSAAQPFWVDMVSQLPSAPSNLVPGTSELPLFTLKPTFSWSASIDNDPNDTTKYIVELADNSLFTGARVSGELTTTNYVFADSLAFGSHYWWRVKAKDRTGTLVPSGTVEFWTWRLGDLNSSHVTDLSDLSTLIVYLVGGGGVTISPRLLGDLSGDCKIDLIDLSILISYLIGVSNQMRPGC